MIPTLESTHWTGIAERASLYLPDQPVDTLRMFRDQVANRHSYPLLPPTNTRTWDSDWRERTVLRDGLRAWKATR